MPVLDGSPSPYPAILCNLLIASIMKLQFEVPLLSQLMTQGEHEYGWATSPTAVLVICHLTETILFGFSRRCCLLVCVCVGCWLVCLCVCVCVCVYECECVYECVYECKCVYECECVYECKCVYECV